MHDVCVSARTDNGLSTGAFVGQSRRTDPTMVALCSNYIIRACMLWPQQSHFIYLGQILAMKDVFQGQNRISVSLGREVEAANHCLQDCACVRIVTACLQ